MRSNSYVLVLIVLVGGLCLTLGFFNHRSDDAAGWNPTALYNDPISLWGGSSYTNATLSGSSANSGWSMPLSGSGFSLRARRVVAPVYYASSPNRLSSLVAGSPNNLSIFGVPYRGGAQRAERFNSLLATSSNMTLHTTSSAEYRSFGGGGNGGYTSSSISSPVAGSPNNLSIFGVPYRGGAQRAEGFNMPNSPIASVSGMATSSSPLASQSSTTPNVPIAAVYANTGAHGYSVYGSSVLSNPTAAYSSAYASGASPISYAGRIVGRQNSAISDSWLQWLDDWCKAQGYGNYGTQGENDTWTIGLNYYALEDAYEAFCEKWRQDNQAAGDPPGFELWLSWFQSNNGSHTANSGNIFNWVPVGDILPLLLLALLYLAAMVIKSQKSSKIS